MPSQATEETTHAEAAAHLERGLALNRLRRYAEARERLAAAARLAPQSAVVWLNLGVACLESRLPGEAAAAFRRAIALEPLRPEAHNILGHALLEQGRCGDAARALAEALRLRPGYPAAHDNMGRVLKAQGRAAEAVAHHRAALSGRPRPETHSNLLFSLNFAPGIPPAEIAAEHRRWADAFEAPLRTGPPRPAPDRSCPRRLRIGYVSPDLVNHAVAYFFSPVLAAHDREGFEVTCYSDAAVPDGVTRRLQTLAGRWRDIAGWSDERVADAVRGDRIDILVDLAGHTARNRLLVFARRPAPVQVTWLGYPNTTGLDAMSYRITDFVSDPPGETEALHSEELVRLPGPFSCYEPCPASPPVGPLPSASAGCVTFGCFNNLAKVNVGVVDLWAGLLASLPGSRLFLESRGLSDPETADRLRRGFAERGVDPGRLDLEGDPLPETLHLARYHRVDVALDTFPYNGATTTCEALWMGVPVVTLAGPTHASRVGASLLTHLGASGWVAHSAADYAGIARRLAGDPRKLEDIRRGLRDRMSMSPLCDARRFARNLESAYRAVWLNNQKGNSPPIPPASAPGQGALADGNGANQNNLT